MKSSFKEWLSVYLKGFAMGAADAVPGVSGGTIALITGIYERLVAAITSINIGNIISLLKSLAELDKDSLHNSIERLDGYFLIILLTGVTTALVTVLWFMNFLLENYTVPTFGFFFGLILLSLLVLIPEINLETRLNKFTAVAGFLLAFLTSGYAATSLNNTPLMVFLAGILAVSAMIMPGISGSLILVILGQYDYISGKLADLLEGLPNFVINGEKQLILDSLPSILIFLAGALIGLFTFAHVVKKALEKHREATMTFLVSLIAGALRAPVVQVERTLSETGSSWLNVMPEFVFAATVGGAIILVLDRKAGLI